LNFVIDVFSDIDLNFEPFRVRLSPYEFGIEEMNFVKSLDFFDEYFKHLLAFSMTINPRRSFESFTKSAVFDLITGCEQFVLIHRGQGTGLTNIAKLWDEFGAA
jgi:hypothetical protein